MATNTYTALRTTTVGTAVSSVTLDLTGITGYTDLVLVGNATTAVANGSICLQFNGDTGNNYSYTAMYGTGSAAGSLNASNSAIIGFMGYAAQVPVGTRAMGIAQIQNYSNSTTYKTVLIRNTPAVSATVEAAVGIWRASPTPITSITVLAISGASLAAGSTFTVYGVAAWAPEVSPKATGGYVYQDSNYYYHSFPFSGTFTPNQSITAEVLVIAGGGGGGDEYGGGGGAGALRYWASQSLTATGYTCTVGAGGNGGASSVGATGSSSAFGALASSAGGGGGGSRDYSAATNGGSGGGGAGWTPNTAGTGTTGGNNGSAGTDSVGNSKGGGGGGAGAAGGASSSSVGGAGGDGLNTYSAWSTATLTGVSGYYAGGGGGGGAAGTAGSGGAGGGAAGIIGNGVSGNNAIVSTGGGGGGAGNNGPTGGNGGSGLIIVRYAK
jgi:hypothetical protein